MQGVGLRATRVGFWLSGFGFRGVGFRGFGFRVSDFGFRVWGFWFRFLGFGVSDVGLRPVLLENEVVSRQGPQLAVRARDHPPRP